MRDGASGRIKIEDVVAEEREQLGLPRGANPDVYWGLPETERPITGADSALPPSNEAQRTSDEPWALCLSGGGIRSATFGLGILQGLAKVGELSRFHYLSTVSGGGYIGSWLSRWIHETEGKLENVQAALAGKPLSEPDESNRPGAAGNAGSQLKEHSERKRPSGEPEQIRGLRAYSNYLSPVWGLSTDFFSLVSIFFRNLLLNWLVLLPLLFVLVLVPRLYVAVSVDPQPPELWLWFLIAAACGLIVLGIAYVVADLPSAKTPAENPPDRFFLLCFVPIAIAAALLGIVIGWHDSLRKLELEVQHYLMAGAVLHIAGCLLGVVWRKARNIGERSETKGGPWIDTALIAGSGAAGGALVYALADWLPTAIPAFKTPALHATIAVPVLLFAFWLATTLYVALATHWTSEGDREWWARSGAWWLRWSLCWLLGFGLVIYVPQWISNLIEGNTEYVAAGGGLWGVLVAFIGYWTKNRAKITDRAQTAVGTLGMRLLDLAAVAFLVGVVIAFCLAIDFAVEKTYPAFKSAETTKEQAKDRWASADDVDKAARAAEAAARVAAARIAKVQKATTPASGSASSEVVALDTSIEEDVRTAAEAAKRLAEVAPKMDGNLAERLKAAETAARTSETLAKSRQVVETLAPTSAAVMLEAQKDVSKAALSLLGTIDKGIKDSVKQPWGARYAERMEKGGIMWSLMLFTFLLVVSAVAAAFVGVNTFSLHSMYGNRLVRAYFGAARDPKKRKPHWFSGFDFGDNVGMAELKTGSIPSDGTTLQGADGSPEGDMTTAQAGPQRDIRLLHIVNIALNLVSTRDGRLEWQQRKAASFTVSKLHSGSDVVGFLPSSKYSKITLGRAMTISGAAASSNMGYHSSTPVALVMTLFNVRLGWWLPNPGYKGKLADFANAASEPRWALRPLLWEALSAIDEQKPYLYLSDGGHFDNLGLYEMVRRGCRRIVVIDATADPDCVHNDLQDVMRKIRVDFGISIDFEPQALAKPQRCVLGTIEYRNGPPGCLYYIKPTLCGDEPLDLQRYAAESRVRSPKSAFPHQSTGDQFFNEVQFESYRLLGFHTITTLWALSEDRSAKWPSKPSLEAYKQTISAYAKSDAGVKSDKSPPASTGSGSAPGSGGLFSGISQAAHSMSQGALVATAIGVGGAVGVGSTVALQDTKPAAEVKTTTVPPPAILADSPAPGRGGLPGSPLNGISDPAVGGTAPLGGGPASGTPDPRGGGELGDTDRRARDSAPQRPPGGSQPAAGQKPADKDDRRRTVDVGTPQKPVNLEAEFGRLAKILEDIRTDLGSAMKEVPTSVGASNDEHPRLSGSRLNDIQVRLDRVEKALSQAPSVRATR